MCDANSGENAVEWADRHAKALYIDRLGVNIKHSKKGIGSLTLEKAMGAARAFGAEYLRLFVVDINNPAIQFYIKNRFVRAAGVYNETFDDGFVLREYGYETKL